MRDTEVVIDAHECIFDFTGDRVVLIGADLESSIAWNSNLTAAQANVDPAYDSTPVSLAADFNEWFEDWGALSRKSDWIHVNAIRRVTASVGGLSVDYYIASLRHLSAVVAFSYNPGESSSEDIAQHLWTLSGEVDSDFQLQSDLDGVDPRFWNQHDASILDNGNLLLFDNANVITYMATGQRTFDTVSFMPNTEQRTTSRAVEYQLDFTTMTATLVWEFQCDFAYSGGSARRLNNGHTVIGCAWCGDAGTIFEADEDGNEVGALVLPASIRNTGDDSGDGRFYRTTSWESISGEQRIANLTPAELLGSMTASPSPYPTVAPSVSSAPTSVPTPEPTSSTPPPTQTPIPVPTHTPSSIPTHTFIPTSAPTIGATYDDISGISEVGGGQRTISSVSSVAAVGLALLYVIR